MTPAEFEWAQEKIEEAYSKGAITAMQFRLRMHKLGFTPRTCVDLLDQLDDAKGPSTFA